jgi:hypothetical protein
VVQVVVLRLKGTRNLTGLVGALEAVLGVPLTFFPNETTNIIVSPLNINPVLNSISSTILTPCGITCLVHVVCHVLYRIKKYKTSQVNPQSTAGNNNNNNNVSYNNQAQNSSMTSFLGICFGVCSIVSITLPEFLLHKNIISRSPGLYAYMYMSYFLVPSVIMPVLFFSRNGKLAKLINVLK